MQDKHIDKLLDKELWVPGLGQEKLYKMMRKRLKDEFQSLITTEQLAIWNKALELVESMLERGFGFPKEGTEDFKRGKFTKHISSQELIEAIQQEIDRIGGKE